MVRDNQFQLLIRHTFNKRSGEFMPIVRLCHDIRYDTIVRIILLHDVLSVSWVILMTATIIHITLFFFFRLLLCHIPLPSCTKSLSLSLSMYRTQTSNHVKLFLRLSKICYSSFPFGSFPTERDVGQKSERNKTIL